MIGKIMRGIRHLKNSVGNLEHKKGLILCGDRVYSCNIINFENNIYLLQESIGNRIEDVVKNYRKFYNKFSDVISMRPLRCVCVNEFWIREMNVSIILLPDNITDLVKEFTDNNKKLMNVLVNKYCDTSHAYFLYFFIMASEAPNIVNWAIINTFKYGVPFALLKNVVNWYNIYGKLPNKPSKGSITSYNGDAILGLVEELREIRAMKRSNDVINTFNTAQKKILKSIELTPQQRTILSRFSALSNKKKTNFIQKMSTIEDASEIFRQMSLLCNIIFSWNKESFLDYVHNAEFMNCDVVYNVGNVVIVKVNTFDTIKYLAKSTNWCISKNKQYWNNYNEKKNVSQYVMYDFDEKEDGETSIVGFTVKDNVGITHAHSFTNNNMMAQTNDSILKTWMTHKLGGILKHLESHNIPETVYMKPNLVDSEWDKASVIKKIEKVVGSHYTVISDSEDKFAISCDRLEVALIIGDHFHNIFNHVGNSKSVMLFFDFTKKGDDLERILIALVESHDDVIGNYEFVPLIFNANAKISDKTFNMVREKFGLPSYIINESSNKLEDFIRTVNYKHTPLIKEMLKDEKLKNSLSDKFYGNSLASAIHGSIVHDKSFDLIDLFNEEDLPISVLVSKRMITSVLCDILSNARHYFNEEGCKDGYIPTEQDFKTFYSGDNMSTQKRLGVGFFVSIIKLLSPKMEATIFTNIIDDLHNMDYLASTVGFKELIFSSVMARDKCNLNETPTALLKALINLSAKYNCVNTINYILENSSSKDVLTYTLSKLSKDTKLKEAFKQKVESVVTA